MTGHHGHPSAVREGVDSSAAGVGLAECTEVRWMAVQDTAHVAWLKPQKPVGIARAAKKDSELALGCVLPAAHCRRSLPQAD